MSRTALIAMYVTKEKLTFLSLLTLIGMGGAGILMVHFLQDTSLKQLFFGQQSIWLQALIGLIYGAFAAVAAVVLLHTQMLSSMRNFFADLVGSLNPSWLHILFYSFCAGVGEELLFRAGIQPFIKIWPTAFVFVALHGYLNPFNLKMSVYGIFLILICAGFGYLFLHAGIYAAISAHFIYDVIMFGLLKVRFSGIDKVIPQLDTDFEETDSF